MEALSFGLALQFLPAVLLVLAALAVPELYVRLVRRMLDDLRAHLAEWLYILLDSYVRPTAQILRVLLLYLARRPGRLARRADQPPAAEQRAEQAGPADQPDDGPLF